MQKSLKKNNSKKIHSRIAILLLPLMLVASLAVADTFNGPSQLAPLGNASAPVNDSEAGQVKIGGLSLGSLLVNGGSVLQGKVGIGTISGPGGVLNIKGSNYNQLNIAHSGNSGWGLMLTNSNGVNNSGYHYSTSGLNSSAAVVNVSNDALHFATNNTVRATISHNGNVGIGTITPSRKFDVSANGASMVAKFGSNLASGFIQFSNSGSAADKVRIGATSDRLVLSTNYLERLSIINNGNVGIGTTAPTQKLDVKGQINVTNSDNISLQGLKGTRFGYGTGYRVLQLGSSGVNPSSNIAIGVDLSGNASGVFQGDGRTVYFRNGVSFGTPNTANTGFYYPLIMKDGNVGIGMSYNSTPTQKLDVAGNINFTGDLYKNGSLLSTDNKKLFSHSAYSITNSTAPATLGNGHIRQDFINTFDGGGSAYRTVLSLSGYRASSQWSQLAFNYNSGLNAPMYLRNNNYHGATWGSWNRILDSANSVKTSDVLQIDGAGDSYLVGNVGIGTTTPNEKLEVSDGSIIAGKVSKVLIGRHSSLYPNSSNSAGYFELRTNNTSGNNGGLSIYTLAGGSSTEKFRVSAGGNVGIGITNPTQKLDVAGNINFTGDLYKNGTLFVGGAENINGLNDAATDSSSVYLGLHAGNIGTGETAGRTNVGIGLSALDVVTTGYQNVALGHTALMSNTTGTQNTGIGFYALRSSTTATGDTAIGSRSLQSNTTGSHNSGLGFYALNKNTTGYYNTALGSYSMYDNITGAQNAAVGFYSMRTGTAGTWNAALGSYAMEQSTGSFNVGVGGHALRLNKGNSNVGVGGYALYADTTTRGSTAVGHTALQHNNSNYNAAFGYAAAIANTTGYMNTALGAYRPLASNTTGNYNVAIGSYAVHANTTGTGNVGVGHYSGGRITNASYNTSLGYASGQYITTGTYNVALGYNAGTGLTTGTNNISIGNATALASGTGSNQINIGNTFKKTATGIELAGGNVGIGTSSPTVKLHIEGGDVIQKPSPTSSEIKLSNGNRLSGNSSLYIDTETTGDILLRPGGSPWLVVKNTGNVGIGTTTPTQKLEVVGKIKSTSTLAGDAGTTVTTKDYVDAKISGGIGAIVELDPGIAARNLDKITVSNTGKLTVNGTSTSILSAEIRGVSSGGTDIHIISDTAPLNQKKKFIGNYGGSLRLGTITDDAFNRDFQLNILNTGNVGIGTTAPTQKLDVAGNILISKRGGKIKSQENGYNNSMEIGTTSWGNGANFMVNATADGASSDTWSNSAFSIDPGSYGTAAGLIRFDGNAKKWRIASSDASTGTGNGVVWKEHAQFGVGAAWVSPRGNASDFTVASDGNVGIGITNPTQKLDVAGNINFTGDLYKNGVIVALGGGANAINDLSDAKTTVSSIFLGLGSGQNNSGYNNTAIGLSSLNSNTTGLNNTANGYLALSVNTIAGNNTANGSEALKDNLSGSNNTANGRAALRSNTTGAGNTASGTYSLVNNSTGTYNVSNGYLSLASNTVGSYNTSEGYMSLYNNISGDENVANGYASLSGNTTGMNNTASGSWSLNGNQTGSFNSVYGHWALKANNSGRYNIAMGKNAGYQIDGGWSNTTGDYNIFLGVNTKALADDDQNEIVIGANAVGNGSNSVTLGADTITKTVLKGNVGIGSTVPTEKLDVNGNVKATAFLYSSDRRLKKNISEIKNPIEKIMQLEGVAFTWKENGKKDIGFIAQDVEKVFPELVTTANTKDGLKSVQYGNIIAPLLEAVKEQQKQIESLEERIKSLEK